MTDMSQSLHPFDNDDDRFHEECGVFGIYGHTDAAALTALGLHALQHRGQEACGIAAFDGTNFNTHRNLGLVGDTFGEAHVIAGLKGHVAIGHNRYATCGGTMLRNVQPFYADLAFGGFAVAHNGNLTNAYKTRQELVMEGSIFQSTSDTETIVHLVARSQAPNVLDRLVSALHRIQGAYALVCVAQGRLFGVRDPHGVRPLCLGRLGESYILTSETCALDIIGATYVREIEPGEVIIIGPEGIESHKPFEKTTSRFCIFEYIYFARPDSAVDGRSVYEARKKIGMELAMESPVTGGDVVVPVPDSGVPGAIGYAAQSGLPFELGIIRNHYVGRTFIEPTDQIRHLGVKLKHNANPGVIAGKSVILVDDSIVRGTTSRKIVDMIRQAGAREVHMRIASPPSKHPCFYGIDTPTSNELLANRLPDVEAIRAHIGVDSLAYLSLDGLYRALGEEARDANNVKFCDACLSGDYPIPLIDFAEDENRTRTVSALGETLV